MSNQERMRFNPPPGWPPPPPGWRPPRGWTPDPSWPAMPNGWELWIADGTETTAASAAETPGVLLEPDHESVAIDDPVALRARIAELETQVAVLRSSRTADPAAPGSGVANPFNDEQVLRDAGVYRYHHPLESAVAYRDRLAELDERIAEAIRGNAAIEASTSFTLDGSLAKGKAMVNALSRLMLRAYNAEAENAVRSMRVGNVDAARRRLEGSRVAIASLGKLMDLRIADSYHALRIQEVELTADYAAKKEEEREAARAERERLREERKVEAELAAAKEKLEKERSHVMTVLDRLRATGASDPTLEAKLSEIDSAIEQNCARQANIRAGYVYVISNRGSFGPRVVKIGLTRRLEPMERIHELGDASVPFRFDVNALFFSEDAVQLESDLHSEFGHFRLNWINERKEFFFATPGEVRAALQRRVGNLLEFSEDAGALEFLQSVRNWPLKSPADLSMLGAGLQPEAR